MALLDKTANLDIIEFGRELIGTGDLDPVYTILWEANLSEIDLKKFMLAYWCYYHVGTASWITSQADYWSAMYTCIDKSYPRCRERRHFRGDNAAKSIRYLAGVGLDSLYYSLVHCGKNAADKMAVSQQWVGFGPWISFKIADMLERLSICEVAFDLDTVMYDSPTKAAVALCASMGKNLSPREAASTAVRYLSSRLGSLLAPPRYERVVGYQEYETILCKFGSSESGHYHLGEDIFGCRSALLDFGRSKVAQRLLRGGRSGGLW